MTRGGGSISAEAPGLDPQATHAGIFYRRVKSRAVCRGCSRTFIPRDSRYATYCSRACSYADPCAPWRRRQTKSGPHCKVFFLSCAQCARPFVSRRASRLTCSGECLKARARAADASRNQVRSKRSWDERECPECGARFAPSYGDKRRTYCSAACAARRARRIAKHLRDARAIANGFERFDPIEIFDRDAWRCRICGAATPRHLRGTTAERAPELDHVVPLSKGGPHSRGNVQCACRRCNLLKADAVFARESAP